MSTTNRRAAAVAAQAGELPMVRASAIASPQSILETLFAAAEGNLSDGELMTVVDGANVVKGLCERAFLLTEGLGCLISSAGDTGTGVLQSRDDVAKVLWLLGDMFDLVAGLSHVSACAADRLNRRGVLQDRAL